MTDDSVTIEFWAVQLDGSEDPLFVSDAGIWATVATARGFRTEAAAREAKVPEGTTGTPVLLSGFQRR